MKTILKKIITVAVVVIVGLIIIFWGRIQATGKVLSLINYASEYINNGKESYDFSLTAVYKNKNSSDSLTAEISYNQGMNFYADVNYKQKNYKIISGETNTQVFLQPTNLIISAQGIDRGNFDLLKLLGDILKSYPQTSELSNLSLMQKVGITVWIFTNASFYEVEDNGILFDKISIPLSNFNIQLLIGQSENHYKLIANSDDKSMNISVKIVSKNKVPKIPSIDSITKLEIEREELNTAIYRGALRAGGIILSRIEIPRIDTTSQTFGNGKLAFIDGNRVLIAEGTHREIGRIEGALLRDEIRKMIDATLYTMCWIYTSEKKSWFIDDFRSAYERLKPFIPDRFNDEMEGMAETSKIPLSEIQLTNVFPALFHCSGFAVFNSASINGKLYHGRVLDYIVDLGLQFSSVVFIIKPEGYNAFANVGYAGFIGSVTGMNEKQVSFGEMGGRGEGDWDGMPMAFLIRDGMERANTLNEAVEIFSATPRTCEYYYVIADGKIPDARGLATTPTFFDVIKPNEYREKLDEPLVDAVIMSAGDRYKILVKRIKDEHGKISSDDAIRLMDRPVAMKSNLHNALFAPQSLDFWVANAGNNSPACNEPYTKYNLMDLIKSIK